MMHMFSLRIIRKFLHLSGFIFLLSCYGVNKDVDKSIIPAAECIDEYRPFLLNKRVALVANQSSLVDNVHLIDTLLSHNINIVKVFTPEHGFKGEFDAGKKVYMQKKYKERIPLVSLYGKTFKPLPQDLKDVDIVVFDIQDVGVRFFTYLSTLHYVMEACAENGKKLLILDRPNPNGFYVDGPVLDLKYSSFVGMHPVPVVYGMTIAEYALMINGEKWLNNGIQCEISYIRCHNYDHSKKYQLLVSPSPNLSTMNAVYLYPSLALFEGTVVNAGRGTPFPFEVFGHPKLKGGNIVYTPVSIEGKSKYPKHLGVSCHGIDLRNYNTDSLLNTGHINLAWLRFAYNNIEDTEPFFTPYFINLCGNAKLSEQIIDGVTNSEIRLSWKPQLEQFNNIRKKYLLYDDFLLSEQ